MNRKFSKLIDQVYLFIKMYGVNRIVRRTSFRGMAFFFSDFVTQYFEDIFSEPPKS